MMLCMSIVVVVLSVIFLFLVMRVSDEAPRDVRDVSCFLAMLVVCLAIVLVVVVKGC